MTRHTLVVRTEDDQYHLFTYEADAVHKGTINPGARVRVNGGAPDESGTRVAEGIVVIQPSSGAAHSETGAQAAQPPPEVNKVTKEIESEARRWHVGGKLGTGLSPELFMLGAQASSVPFLVSACYSGQTSNLASES